MATRLAPVRPGDLEGLAAIDSAPAPLTGEQVLKAVSGFATGALTLSERRLAALYKLGEAYRLWGARSEGVKAATGRVKAPAVTVSDTDST